MSDDTTNGTTTAEPEKPFAEAVAASAVADEAREERSKPYEDRFLVPMTDEDRAKLLVDLGALSSEIDLEEEEAKRVAKLHRESLDGKHTRLRDLIRSGRDNKIEKHLRVVDVRVLSQNVMRIVREDNGETVFERPLAFGERQADLFPKSAKTPVKIAETNPPVDGGPASPLQMEPSLEVAGEADRGDPVPEVAHDGGEPTQIDSAPVDLASRRKKGRKKKES